MKKGEQRPILIANWKTHLNRAQSIKHFEELGKLLTDEVAGRVEIIVCPSAVMLSELCLLNEKMPGKIKIGLGAQDVSQYGEGSYTGEITAEACSGLAKYVLVNHSERRKYLKENDAAAAAKVRRALGAGLVPVLLVGEEMATRRKGGTAIFLEKQLEAILKGVRLAGEQRIVVAYEPVWAIGPEARPAEPAQVSEAGRVIRLKLGQLLGPRGKGAPIIYGGGADSKNIIGFYDAEEMAGAIVGQASLVSKEFAQMARKLAYH